MATMVRLEALITKPAFSGDPESRECWSEARACVTGRP
jgi:hypothetical protein